MRVYFLGAIYLTCVWWGKAQVLPFFMALIFKKKKKGMGC